MFVATYDDRFVLPDYFPIFIDSVASHAHLNFITPAKFVLSRKGVIRRLRGSSSCSLIRISKTVEWDLIVNQFDSVFVNLSTNSKDFERVCFLRWFALNSSTNHLKSEDYICLLDSDFLLGISPEYLIQECIKAEGNGGFDLIAYWGNPNAICPEITIIKKRSLFSFCEYLIAEYFSMENLSVLRSEMFGTVGRGFLGGISDMQAMARWARLKGVKSFNLANLSSLGMIDNLNNFSDKNSHLNLRWEIVFEGSRQYLNELGAVKHLVGTHFQGGAKRYMVSLKELSKKRYVLDDEFLLKHKQGGGLDLVERLYGKFMRNINSLAGKFLTS